MGSGSEWGTVEGSGSGSECGSRKRGDGEREVCESPSEVGSEEGRGEDRVAGEDGAEGDTSGDTIVVEAHDEDDAEANTSGDTVVDLGQDDSWGDKSKEEDAQESTAEADKNLVEGVGSGLAQEALSQLAKQGLETAEERSPSVSTLPCLKKCIF